MVCAERMSPRKYNRTELFISFNFQVATLADNNGKIMLGARTIITFEPVHAATTSWIVYGVTITMKPNDIAAIVLDVDPLKTLSCSSICV